MRRDFVGWMLLSLVFVLLLSCGQGLTVKGNGDGSNADDDTGPTEPPPAPSDCSRDRSDYSIILLTWKYNMADYDLLDKFVIKRATKSSFSDEQEIDEIVPDTSTVYQQYQDDSAECSDVVPMYYYRIYAVNSAGESHCGPVSAARDCQN